MQHFSVSGEIDAACAASLLQTVAADAAHAPLAAVCDYRAANLALSPSQLLGVHARFGDRLVWPTALVVRSDCLGFWERYAEMQGRRGRLRNVFVRMEDAKNWAAEMAAIQEAQARWMALRV